MSLKTLLYFKIALYWFTILKVIAAKTENQKSQMKCMQAGNFWNSIYETNNPNNLTSPDTCLSISSSCCYFHLTYQYNTVPIEQNYCFPLTGDISDWVRNLKNIYGDELMYLANFTNDYSYLLKSIGNNLVYEYYQNYTCMELHQLKDYSSYNQTRCEVFDDDGSCLIKTDDGYFQKFTKTLYNNVSNSFCSNLDADGNCLDLKKDIPSNNTALIPLLNIIKEDLQLDGGNHHNVNQYVNKSVYNWPLPCKPTPKVNIQIICPQDYSASTFLEVNNSLNLFLFVLYLLIL